MRNKMKTYAAVGGTWSERREAFPDTLRQYGDRLVQEQKMKAFGDPMSPLDAAFK